jgi:hypothetical protein
MDVQTCIETFQTLAQDMFTPRLRVRFGGATMHRLFGSSTFSARKLEAAIQGIIRENAPKMRAAAVPSGPESGEDSTEVSDQDEHLVEEMPMLAARDQHCKVYAA